MMEHIDALDPLIHQPTRLRLLAALSKPSEAVSFQALMEQAGLVVRERRLAVSGFAVTWVALTPTGRGALARHLAQVCAVRELMSKQEEH